MLNVFQASSFPQLFGHFYTSGNERVIFRQSSAAGNHKAMAPLYPWLVAVALTALSLQPVATDA
jgi:hypothetical protein